MPLQHPSTDPRWRGCVPGINIFSGDATLVKTKVSLEQQYHEVQCVKDHYPESVVWKSIIRSLKGAAAYMVQYMGPTTSMAHIFWKLSVIFGTVASSHVLMQNFYKVTPGNNEKVPSFAMRLKGILNQIRLQCPGRMTGLEVQQHIKDCLFHEVWKYIHDSTWYLYITPRISYSQMMIITHKAETKKEEIQDKARARAAVVSDLGEGMAELGQQIAKLMAVLTKAGQGSNPSSAPRIPQKRGCGRGLSDSNTPSCSNTHNGRSGPGPPQPTAYPLGVRQGAMELGVMDRGTQGQAQGGRAQPIGGNQILSNALGTRVRPHG